MTRLTSFEKNLIGLTLLAAALVGGAAVAPDAWTDRADTALHSIGIASGLGAPDDGAARPSNKGALSILAGLYAGLVGMAARERFARHLRAAPAAIGSPIARLIERLRDPAAEWRKTDRILYLSHAGLRVGRFDSRRRMYVEVTGTDSFGNAVDQRVALTRAERRALFTAARERVTALTPTAPPAAETLAALLARTTPRA